MNPMFTDIIGEEVRIIKSNDPSLLGIKGKVVNETKNMLVIRSTKEIKVAKKIVHLDIRGKAYDMSKIRFRPEDKIKKMRRKGRI